MAAGDFINRVNEQIAAQRMWNDPRSNRELQTPVETAMAVLGEQAVTFQPVMSGPVCIGVEAIYLKSCNDTVTDCMESGNNLASCAVSGVEAEGVKKTYTPNVCLTKSIKVSADDCAGFTSFEEKLAFMKLKAKNELEVSLNSKMIAALVANAQVNAHPGDGTIDGTTTGFASANWEGAAGAALISKLHVSAIRNKILNAYIVNGSNFFEANFLYNYKEKAGSQDRFDSIFQQGPYRMYWDIFALDAAVGDPSSFMIEPSAIAFFNQNEYENSEKRELKSDLWVYKEPSMRLTYRDGQATKPVYFDVTEEWTCAVSGNDPVKHRRYSVVNVEFVLRGGIITGPPDCNGGLGILHYNQI